MKKLIGILMLLALIGISATKQLTPAQEQKMYLQSSDYKSMQLLLKAGNIIQPLQVAKTCYWIYTCPSGFVWTSTTHYLKCPFCGNAFLCAQYWCAGDPIIN